MIPHASFWVVRDLINHPVATVKTAIAKAALRVAYRLTGKPPIEPKVVARLETYEEFRERTSPYARGSWLDEVGSNRKN